MKSKELLKNDTFFLIGLTLFVILTTGCVTDFSKPTKGSPPIHNLEPIPVKLSEELKKLKELVASREGKTWLAPVGQMIQIPFIDDSDSFVKMGLINSNLQITQSDVFIVGVRLDGHYTISVSLEAEGELRTISSHGFGSSGESKSVAAKHAIENALFDLYSQVSFLLKK
jgi:hypothetical protein